jgi:hypothetical protein
VKRRLLVTLLLLAAYVGGYLAFRQARAEIWPQDGQAYVIFPERGGLVLYYLWRPLLLGRASDRDAHSYRPAPPMSSD